MRQEARVLVDLVAHNAVHRPDAPAYADDQRQLTWSGMAELVQAMALVLGDHGVGPGDRVATFAGNRVEVVAMYFAVGVVGGVVVPLNDRLPAHRVRELLGDSGAVGLVTDRQLGAKVPASSDGWRLCLDAHADQWPLGRGGPLVAGPPGATSDDIALQMYTSGTTQAAKGVLLSHRHVIDMLPMWVPYLHLTPDSRYLQLTPLFHIGGFAMMMVAASVGMSVRIAPGFQPDLAARALQDHRITHTLMVPAMLRWLLLEPASRSCDVSSLQLVLYGGSPMPLALLRDAMARLGCGFLQGYGLTETVAILTALTVEDHATALAEQDTAKLASVGRPLRGIDLRLVDADGHDVAVGQPGEIIAKGPHITGGYHHRPEANEASFRDGWFHTGDLGRLDDAGYVSIIGRLKDLIIVGGENVAPMEVEAVIGAIDGVEEVAVVGAPHPVWGESVCAVVVASPGTDLGERAIITQCRTQLAPYQCPSQVQFIDALPRNAAGKIQKSELRAPLWAHLDRPL